MIKISSTQIYRFTLLNSPNLDYFLNYWPDNMGGIIIAGYEDTHSDYSSVNSGWRMCWLSPVSHKTLWLDERVYSSMPLSGFSFLHEHVTITCNFRIEIILPKEKNKQFIRAFIKRTRDRNCHLSSEHSFLQIITKTDLAFIWIIRQAAIYVISTQ